MRDNFGKKQSPTKVNNFIQQEAHVSFAPGQMTPPRDNEDIMEHFRDQIREAPRGLFGLERLFVLGDEQRVREISYEAFV